MIGGRFVEELLQMDVFFWATCRIVDHCTSIERKREGRLAEMEIAVWITVFGHFNLFKAYCFRILGLKL